MKPDSIGTKIRSLRTQKGLSMEALADRSGITLRTIQRVETGASTPRGYTLNQIARALELDINSLNNHETYQSPDDEAQALKWINLSALLILFLPLSNVITPLILWWRYRHIPLIKQVGSQVVSFQIIWMIVTSFSLIAAPFALLLFEKPTITVSGAVIFTYLGFWLFNIVMTIIAATHIRHEDWDKIYSRVPTLV